MAYNVVEPACAVVAGIKFVYDPSLTLETFPKASLKLPKQFSTKLKVVVKAALNWARSEINTIPLSFQAVYKKSHRRKVEELIGAQENFIIRLYEAKDRNPPTKSDLSILTEAIAARVLAPLASLFRLRMLAIGLSELPEQLMREVTATEFGANNFQDLDHFIHAKTLTPAPLTAPPSWLLTCSQNNVAILPQTIVCNYVRI